MHPFHIYIYRESVPHIIKKISFQVQISGLGKSIIFIDCRFVWIELSNSIIDCQNLDRLDWIGFTSLAPRPNKSRDQIYERLKSCSVVPEEWCRALNCLVKFQVERPGGVDQNKAIGPDMEHVKYK